MRASRWQQLPGSRCSRQVRNAPDAAQRATRAARIGAAHASTGYVTSGFGKVAPARWAMVWFPALPPHSLEPLKRSHPVRRHFSAPSTAGNPGILGFDIQYPGAGFGWDLVCAEEQTASDCGADPKRLWVPAYKAPCVFARLKGTPAPVHELPAGRALAGIR